MNRIIRAADALGIRMPRNVRTKLAKLAALLLALTGLAFPALTDAATLSSASVSLSDPRPSQTSVSYSFKGSSVTSTNIQCVMAVFATTQTGDTAPTGWSGASGTVTAASSTMVNSSATNWTLATSDGTGSTGQKNIWKYTNSAGGVTPSTLTGATFIMAGITNSSTADTAYYLKLSTYNNTDCTSSPVDNATVEFINTNGSTLSLTVDNSLSFTVAGVSTGGTCNTATSTQTSTATTIPFGTVTSAANSIVCQNLTAATNATNGYTIYIRDTGQAANALSQTLADWTGTNAAPTTWSSAGTEGYGYTTDDSTLGTGTAARFTTSAPKWAGFDHSNTGNNALNNHEVAYEAAGVSSTTYHLGFQAGVSNTTHPGTYTTTVLYTCTPIY